MKKKGFTLIELLVAVAILGILATVGLGAFFSSQIKGRDAQRKSDLGQIQKALEMYLSDKGIYPAAADIPWGGSWTDPAGTGELYMKEVPQDPHKPDTQYFYEVDPVDSSWYHLYAKLENAKDPQIVASGYAGTDCGTGLCNYQVSSTNAP
jgi:prepilin-type N-terminal cleavage/methylation domain-containing protein